MNSASRVDREAEYVLIYCIAVRGIYKRVSEGKKSGTKLGIKGSKGEPSWSKFENHYVPILTQPSLQCFTTQGYFSIFVNDRPQKIITTPRYLIWKYSLILSPVWVKA